MEEIFKIIRKEDDTRLFLDTCAWGENNRANVDIDVQHLSYYFPFNSHANMYEDTENLLVVGTDAKQPLYSEGESSSVSRELFFNVPLIAHEVCHYTALRDYKALKAKFKKYGAKELRIDYSSRKGKSPYSSINIWADFSDKESAKEFKKLFEDRVDEVPYDKAENGTPSRFRAIDCGVGFECDIMGEFDYETIYRGLERIGKNCLVEREELQLQYNSWKTSGYYSGYPDTYYNKCIGRAWRADISAPAEFDRLCEDMNNFPYGNDYFKFNIEAFFVFE